MIIGKRKTFLVVDDIPLMRAMLTKYLKTLGTKILREEFGRGNLDVIEASSGKLAFELLRELDVDLIFLDLMMPEMDGLTFLARKREDPEICDIPVVVCSALEEKETVNRASALGARAFMTKPFTLKSVEEKFREAFSILQA